MVFGSCLAGCCTILLDSVYAHMYVCFPVFCLICAFLFWGCGVVFILKRVCVYVCVCVPCSLSSGVLLLVYFAIISPVSGLCWVQVAALCRDWAGWLLQCSRGSVNSEPMFANVWTKQATQNSTHTSEKPLRARGNLSGRSQACLWRSGSIL